MNAPDADVVLAADGLVKRYPGTVALDGMSVTVRRHEILGLVGENGAGKSTLLKSFVGLVRPDHGRLLVRGAPVALRGVQHANALGIAMVYQEQSLVPNLTVAENILLGSEGRSVRGGWYRWKPLFAAAQRHLDRLQIDVDAAARTDTLTFAQRQMVEIAKAMAIEERTQAEPVILLDEPTSVLEAQEVERLFEHVRHLRERASVVFVSHRLDEVLALSDRVHVLRGGRSVAEVNPQQADVAELHSLLVGHASPDSHYHLEQQDDAVPAQRRLVVSGLATTTRTAVSFSAAPGEVVALAGVEGSGREAVARGIFGDAARTVTLTLDGKTVALRNPRRASRHGIGFVPAERRTDGMIAPLSVAENMSLSHVREFCRGPFVDVRAERKAVRRWVDRLGIKTPGLSTPIGALSGGNQQKVTLARWLLSPDLRVLVLDHPTRGLDVGAKSEVYRLIRDLAGQGCTVILIADTLEEAIAMSHRVLVLKDGEIRAEIPAPADHKPAPVDIVRAMV